MRRGVWAIVLLFAMITPLHVSAQSGDRCFPETGQCITGRIREFWEQNGGLPVFGFPIGPQQEQTIEGKPVQAQNFERNRLELHPENARPYDVLLGRLGVDRLAQQGRDWFTFPKGSEQPACRFFSETGHSVCGAFLGYFRVNGLNLNQPGVTETESLALFGLPLSEAADEVSPTDGKTYLTQHFERARFEFHPENQPPYNVLLGLLGNELRDNASAPVNPPTTPPAPTEQVISGKGNQVNNIGLTTASTLAFSHNGSRNFIVTAYPADGRSDLLVNEIGGYKGTRWLAAGTYMIEIVADGDWSMTIAPFGRNDSAVGGISGFGDTVSGTFANPGRPTAYHFSHNGSSNFAVWLVCSEDSDLAVNEIGPVESDGVVQADGSQCFWDVNADGAWSITRK